MTIFSAYCINVPCGVQERILLPAQLQHRQHGQPPPGRVLRRGGPEQDGQPRSPPHGQVQRPQQPDLPAQHRGGGVPGLS